jgi:hypothetical protein
VILSAADKKSEVIQCIEGCAGDRIANNVNWTKKTKTIKKKSKKRRTYHKTTSTVHARLSLAFPFGFGFVLLAFFVPLPSSAFFCLTFAFICAAFALASSICFACISPNCVSLRTRRPTPSALLSGMEGPLEMDVEVEGVTGGGDIDRGRLERKGVGDGGKDE